MLLEKQVYGTEDPYHKKVEVESRALENIMGIEKKMADHKNSCAPHKPHI